MSTTSFGQQINSYLIKLPINPLRINGDSIDKMDWANFKKSMAQLTCSYEMQTWTATLTGVSNVPLPTLTAYARQIGNLAEIVFEDDLIGICNTTACTVTGLPSYVIPTRPQVVILGVQNNSAQVISNAKIGTNGVITLSGSLITQGSFPGAFTNSGSKGLLACSFTYGLD